jgi:hypothetical protein
MSVKNMLVKLMETMDNLVDNKKEWTSHLTNIISPLIYEGVKSIYDEARGTSNDENEILKNFQKFLRDIVEWGEDRKIKEATRIISCSKCSDIIEDLIRAVIKSNIVLLSATKKKNCLKDKSHYQSVNLSDFFHKIYIECARTFYNYPFLFYHDIKPIDIKRNQKESLQCIEKCIKEGTRKALPLKAILSNYLNEDIGEISEKKSEQIGNKIKEFLDYQRQKSRENSENKYEHNVSDKNPNKDSDRDSVKHPNKDSDRDSVKHPNKDSDRDSVKHPNKDSDRDSVKHPIKYNSINKLSSDTSNDDSDRAILDMIRKSRIKITEMDTKMSDQSKQQSLIDVKNDKDIEKEVLNIVKKTANNDSDTSVSYTNGVLNDDNFEAVFSNTGTQPIHLNSTNQNKKSKFFLN